MKTLIALHGVDSLGVLGMNVLAQILLVVLLAWVLGRTVARHDPAIRHAVWMCALFCVLASPLTAWGMNSAGITLIAIPFPATEPASSTAATTLPAAVSEPGMSSEPAGENLGPAVGTSVPEPFLGERDRRRSGESADRSTRVEQTGSAMAPTWQHQAAEWVQPSVLVAGIVWAVGTLVLLGRLAYGCLTIGRIHRTLDWTTPPWLADVRRDASQVLGVDRLPPIALSPAAAGPLTMGVMHPVVVLPAGLVDRLDRRQLLDVLVHEFAHALRRDTLVGLLQRLAAALFWPHPLVYVLNRELAQAREELCDNFVLRKTEAQDYAETLMLVAEAFPPRRRPAMVGLLEQRGRLERRVAGLLDEKRKATTRLSRGVALVLGAAFFATAMLVAGTRVLHAEPQKPATGRAEAEAETPRKTQEPLTLDLARFYPSRKFTRKEFESFSGRQVIDGLPFEVGGQVGLYGLTPASRGQTSLPKALKEIRVGRKFDELHLIHHTHWPDVDGETIAYFELNYADGTKSTLPIRYGRHVLDWTYMPSYEQESPSDPDTKVCWRYRPLVYKGPSRFFKSMLRNPSPEKVVETVNVLSAQHLSSYVLLAATVADRDPTRPATPPVPPTQPDWKFDADMKIQVVDAKTRKPLSGALVQPSLNVIEQWVAGAPFYTSADGKGTLRYPKDTTSRLAFSVKMKGYTETWKDWRGDYPDSITVELAPQGSDAQDDSFLGRLRKGLLQPRKVPTSSNLFPPLATAVPQPASIHLVGKIRTPPRDNFSLIHADAELVPLEIWRQFGDTPKWRVEKPGRVAVMDGKTTAMLMRPNLGVKLPKPFPSAFDTTVLLGFTDAKDFVNSQIAAVLANGGRARSAREDTPDGKGQLVVTMEQKADVPDKDPNKNHWLGRDSNLRWLFRFNPETHRLTEAEVYLQLPDGDKLVLKIDRVEYDQPIDPAVFALKFPENTFWHQEPQRLPDNEKYEKMSPQEAARAFLEACGKEDWKEAEKFFQYLDPRIKDFLGGLQIVSLGQPFQSQSYPGWYIPYELKLRVIRKVSVRNDNPAHRWIVSFDSAKNHEAADLAKVPNVAQDEKYAKLTPKEAVQAFFDACVKNNVEEAKSFLPPSTSAQELQAIVKQMAGCPAIRVAEATPANAPGQWVVSCEFHLVKKHNLAMRRDNPANRYVVDGGL